jgi:hypothetical protein
MGLGGIVRLWGSLKRVESMKNRKQARRDRVVIMNEVRFEKAERIFI